LANLLGVDIRSIDEYTPHHAPIAIPILLLHADRFSENHIRERLLRSLTKRLSLLWRIDLGQPDLDLLMAPNQHSDRVAVGNTHDPAFEY
jgi:hypothetical protein